MRTLTKLLLPSLFIGLASCGDDSSDGKKPVDPGPGVDATGDAQDSASGGDEATTLPDTPVEPHDNGGGTGDADGGPWSDAPELPQEDTVFNGTHTTLVTSIEGAEQYSGKIGVKLRADGVFSGKGTGSGDVTNTPVAVSVKGEVQAGVVTGEVVWTWTDKPELGQATLKVSGAYLGDKLQLTYKGGNPELKFDGSMSLTKLAKPGP